MTSRFFLSAVWLIALSTSAAAQQPPAAPIAAELADPKPEVRGAAALMNMDDPGGLPLLRALLVSEVPASRLIGAEALASASDGTWMETVRDLTRTGEPTVRVN